MTYKELWHRLTTVYDAGEAKAIVSMVLDVRFGLSTADVLCGKVTQLSTDDQAELEKIVQRLEKSEPVQYVLGLAEFCGRTLHVEQGVLIPRPETEEMCLWVIEEEKGKPETARHYLDIGTGSGCIACTLAAELPGAQVTAWDISEQALAIARDNARRTCVHVAFEHRNVLSATTDHPSPTPRWNAIVSNPPYICRQEAANMAPNVLNYEPEIALFVPDDDPLLFYRAIGHYAQWALLPGGSLYLETNPLYVEQIARHLAELGFDVVERDDQFGKTRFIKATRK